MKSALGRLSRYLATQEFDIVHTHLFHADVYGAAAARATSVGPVVTTKHGFNPWRARPFFAWLDRTAARVQASIITISAAIGDWLVRTERLPAEKRRVVHYALDGEQFRSAARSSAALSSGAPLVGTVSRLLSQKRVDVLLRAVACCVSRHPKVALVIVGEGPERGRLERLSTELGIADWVSFLGHRDDVSGLMRGLDIFALPSSGEGFGLVVLEAYAWSKPVVVSDVLALPEIVESERTGLLVPPGDVGELAGAIDRLAADLNLRQQLGTAGRQRLERDFTVDRMVAATAAVYEDVRSPRRCAVIRRW